MESKIFYVVTSYQNIRGLFESLDDAAKVAKDIINKGNPANIVSMPLTPKCV